MILQIPVAVYQAAVAVDDAPAGPEALVGPLRFVLDIDQRAPGYRRFRDLMLVARAQLSQLAREVGSDIMVMSSSYRFDDACGDDNWLAVLAGAYRFNNGSYFGSAPAPASPHFRQGEAAREVLDLLVEQNWAAVLGGVTRLRSLHKYAAREIGFRVGPEAAHLMIGDSVEGGRAIFWSVEPDAGIAIAGVQSRSGQIDEIDELVDRGEFPEMIGIEDLAAEMFAELQSLRLEAPLQEALAQPRGATPRQALRAWQAMIDGKWVEALNILVGEAKVDPVEAHGWVMSARTHLHDTREREELERWLERLRG